MKGARPRIKARTRRSSRIPCPRIRSGPALNPCREVSLIVAVSNGPGIIAPERAITKDVQKMVINDSMIYTRNFKKIN